MSNDEPKRRPRAFFARLFESDAIKAWKDAEGKALRQALTMGLDAIAEGKPLVLDLLVDIEAIVLEPKVEASTVLHWRSRPSTNLSARVMRSLGFYSGESTLAAAVQVANGAELMALLPNTALWDAEFSIYPVPDRPVAQLPDPHFEVPRFAAAVGWTLMQDAASESWLITARGEPTLDMVCATLTRAFAKASLQATTRPAPDELYSGVEHHG